MKVLLILVDGMRPDAVIQNKTATEFLKKTTYTLNGRTVVPPVTLPCHMSLFHSVDPSRHGILTNTYIPQVRPIQGLFELLTNANKSTALFYNWEQLRDLTRPGSLTFSTFINGKALGYGETGNMLTDAVIKTLTEKEVDFAFLFLAFPDGAGHKFGWMSEAYMDAVENSWRNIERIVKALPEEYQVIITADHGGHDRTHGIEIPEDMTIPIIFFGNKADFDLDDANIKDLAPTIADLLEVAPDEDWEGKSLLK